MGKIEKTLKYNVVYRGKILTLNNDEVLVNGKKSTREVVHHHGGVCILAEVDGKIVFEKQYRYAYGEEVWELPAGKLEEGENSYDAGIRELEEEVGLRAESLIDMGEMYPSCGYTDEKIHLYIAHNVTKVPRHLDEDENIDVYYFSIDEVKEMIMKGQIKDAKTISLVFKYLNK